MSTGGRRWPNCWLSRSTQQHGHLLPVDLDNVPKLYQLQSVQSPAKAPFPVSVVGSARTGQKALPSKDNFHFTLALKSQDAAHGILNMVAGAMQIFMAAFGREGDVAVVPISDDRIFHQTGHTLKQGMWYAVVEGFACRRRA